MSAAGGVLAVLERCGAYVDDAAQFPEQFKPGVVRRDQAQYREAIATVKAMAGALELIVRLRDLDNTLLTTNAEYPTLGEYARAALSRYHGSAAPAGGGDEHREFLGELAEALDANPDRDSILATIDSLKDMVRTRRLASAGSASCAECGAALEEVRPGKHQHPTCSQHPSAGSAPAPSAVPDGMAERITNYLCEQEYDIGGRDELLSHVRAAMAAAPTPETQP